MGKGEGSYRKGICCVPKPALATALWRRAALNGKFQEIVKLALKNMELPYLYEDWERFVPDPLYLAARGAADIAEVWQESEWHCIQHRVCSGVEVGRPKDDGAGITLR